MAQNVLTGTSIAFISRSASLGATATDIVPAGDLPVNTAIEITSMVVCNKSASARTVSIYRKVNGGTSFELLSTVLLAGNTTEVVPVAVNLEAGDSLTGLCSEATDVVVTVSGKKYS